MILSLPCREETKSNWSQVPFPPPPSATFLNFRDVQIEPQKLLQTAPRTVFPAPLPSVTTHTHILYFLKVPGPSTPAVMWLVAAFRPRGEDTPRKINDVSLQAARFPNRIIHWVLKTESFYILQVSRLKINFCKVLADCHQLQPRLQMTGLLEVSKALGPNPPLPLRKDPTWESLPSFLGPELLLLGKEGCHEIRDGYPCPHPAAALMP